MPYAGAPQNRRLVGKFTLNSRCSGEGKFGVEACKITGAYYTLHFYLLFETFFLQTFDWSLASKGSRRLLFLNKFRINICVFYATACSIYCRTLS